MPVGEGEFGRILDPETLLQRCADQCHAAKSRARQTADASFVMTFDNRYGTTVLETFMRGDETGNPGTNNDDVARLAGQ